MSDKNLITCFTKIENFTPDGIPIHYPAYVNFSFSGYLTEVYDIFITVRGDAKEEWIVGDTAVIKMDLYNFRKIIIETVNKLGWDDDIARIKNTKDKKDKEIKQIEESISLLSQRLIEIKGTET